ncbi:MAG: hypothetical protein ACLPWS_17940 [Rhodomicrobium sp.]
MLPSLRTPRFTPAECAAAIEFWTKAHRVARALNACRQGSAFTVHDLRNGLEIIVANQERLRRDIGALNAMLRERADGGQR